MKTVYFADLTHTAQGTQARCMPLGAGSVAAYIKNKFQDIFHVDLFKIPKDLEGAVIEKCPDILCMSNYAWNLKLTIAFAMLVKQINPRLIVILGGPNFPCKENERQHFLEEHHCIDFYIFGEGEIALANLLQQIVNHDFDIVSLKETKAEMINCSYLDNDKSVIISGKWTRTEKLDQLPCPYTEGLMDKFFDTRLIPLYETTRGCPFSCTFCTDGINEKSKIFRKSHENIEKSLSYISKHIRHCDDLYVADLNFGMYDEDIRTAELISHMKKTTGFPVIFGTALGKSRPDKIMRVVEILDGCLHIGLSFQSTDPDVLSNIKRKNISTPELLAAAEGVGLRDAIDFTEVILALPGDSLMKHYSTLRAGVDLGMSNIRMYQLMLLIGSMMNSAESRKKFGLQTRWRVMPNCAGVYYFFGKELRVAETEEIVVANNTMTFDDYVDCRVMDFVVEVFVNNDWFTELFELVKFHGLKVFDFLVFVKRNENRYPEKISAIFDSFKKDTCKDLFVKKKDIEDYILCDSTLEKHVSGELGNNEILDHKALCYLNFDETVKFVFGMARSFFDSNNVCIDAALQLYMEDLEKFILCRKSNVLNVEKILHEQFNFDFSLISKSSFKVDPHNLIISQNEFRFFHDDAQASIIKKSSLIYGTSVSGLGRFIQNNKMNRMFRQFEHCV